MSRERSVIHWRKADGELACLARRGKDSETSNVDTWGLTRQEKCLRCVSWVSHNRPTAPEEKP